MAASPYEVIFFDLGETLITAGDDWLPGAREALVTFHDQQVRMGIISNTPGMTRAELLATLPADFPLAKFEEPLIILSSEQGVAKPDPEIFRLAISRAGAAPKQCLFVTENPLHVLAALGTGIHSLRLLPPPQSDIGGLPNLLSQIVSLSP